jgi:hypothetical protein
VRFSGLRSVRRTLSLIVIYCLSVLVFICGFMKESSGQDLNSWTVCYPTVSTVHKWGWMFPLTKTAETKPTTGFIIFVVI